MIETWRWFGTPDPISLSEVRQTGATGIVSALHHLPPGTPWSQQEVAARGAEIAAAGLTWEVIESLPVSEAIKTRAPGWQADIEAWIDSLRAIAAADGPRVICYNFMPVLDWTRTQLRMPLANGGTAMRFDLTDFVVFDRHILARPESASDYDEVLLAAAEARFAMMSDAACEMLARNITAGLPGANDSWTLDQVRDLLRSYDGIDAAVLRDNLFGFLRMVVPVAEELGLRLCCHPDDPPFALLGLPRVVSCRADYEALCAAAPSEANGVTFCTGSLGVRGDFDPVAFIQALGPRIHFVHLRNTRRDTFSAKGPVGFIEAEHLDGDTDMVATIRALLAEEARRRAEGRKDAIIPMRPDHGHDLLDDIPRNGQPGYPLIGRLRGLAELRGVMAALAG